jgi:hypothetical protein
MKLLMMDIQNKFEKYKSYIVVGSLILVIGGYYLWQYIQQPVKDLSKDKPYKEYTADILLYEVNSDTNLVHILMDKTISVKGGVKSIRTNENSITIEMGNASGSSSIVCQVDKRHLEPFRGVKENDTVTLKGTLSAYIVDTDLGLGNTLELNYCTPHETKN